MSGPSPASEPAHAAGRLVNRRRIFWGAFGVAAATAGGAVVATATAGPASAASETATASGGVSPAVVILTDAPTVSVDASLGNDFRLTIGGNRTMATPANPANGEQIIFQVTQGSGSPFTLTWDSGYEFSADLPQPALSTTAGQTDLLGFIYNATKGTWLLAAFLNGFN